MEEHDRHRSHSSVDLDQAQELLDRGRLYYGQAEYNEALSCLHVAYDQYGTQDQTSQVAEVANDIGVVYTVLRRWEDAEKWLNDAQRLFVARNDLAGEAQTLGNMGSMMRAKGDLREAAVYLQLSGDRFRLVGDNEQRAITLRSLSVVRMFRLRPFQSLVAYHAALACQPDPSLFQRILRWILALPLRKIAR